MCGRAIRTREWCYCVYDPLLDGDHTSFSTNYIEWALYSLTGDPAELRNLIGRPEYRAVVAQLREELKKQIVGAGEPEASVKAVTIFN